MSRAVRDLPNLACESVPACRMLLGCGERNESRAWKHCRLSPTCLNAGVCSGLASLLTCMLPCCLGLTFVMRSKDGTAWWRDGGSNFKVPIPTAGASHVQEPQVSNPLSRAIIAVEEASAVTLMHRFNRAADLLGDIMQVRPSQALSFHTQCREHRCRTYAGAKLRAKASL